MADNNVRMNYVDSCNLGRVGTGGIALEIKFSMSAGKTAKGPYRNAVFELSPEVAHGLVEALTNLLNEAAKPAQH